MIGFYVKESEKQANVRMFNAKDIGSKPNSSLFHQLRSQVEVSRENKIKFKSVRLKFYRRVINLNYSLFLTISITVNNYIYNVYYATRVFKKKKTIISNK